MKPLRILLTDALGILLMITAPLLGWLPGPGGLPLFIAGLSLLAINHDWAKKLLDSMRKHSGAVLRKLMRKIKLEQLLYWGFVLLAIGFGVYTLLTNDSAERYLGFVYLLVGILLIIIHEDHA